MIVFVIGQDRNNPGSSQVLRDQRFFEFLLMVTIIQHSPTMISGSSDVLADTTIRSNHERNALNPNEMSCQQRLIVLAGVAGFF